MCNGDGGEVGIGDVVTCGIGLAAEAGEDVPLVRPEWMGRAAGAKRMASMNESASGRGVGILKMRRLVTMRMELARVGSKRPTGSLPLRAASSQRLASWCAARSSRWA